jgi:hypothetical protein
MFFKGSRYAKVAEDTMIDSDGREIRYKKIRFIPDVKAQMIHTVTQGERLDHVAHQYYRDSERFWRVCDANHGMWPDDLIAEPGKTLLIPPSED